MIILLCLWIIIIIISVEIFSYFWHRIIAHNDFVDFVNFVNVVNVVNVVNDIHAVHKLHHQDINIDADEDFIWLLFLLILFELFIGILLICNIIPFSFAITTVLPSVAVFLWNWYIHRCYHDDNTWLNNFQWFQNEKARHLIHHHDPSKNYGIASSFMDKIFSTHRYDPSSTLFNI